MSRYIDADALKKRVSELIVPDWTRTLIRSWLDSEPTVDAVPVVHGEFIHGRELGKEYIYGETESGTSLKASGWKMVAHGGGTSWDVPSRRREVSELTLFGEERKYPNCKKTRWEKTFGKDGESDERTD